MHQELVYAIYNDSPPRELNETLPDMYIYIYFNRILHAEWITSQTEEQKSSFQALNNKKLFTTFSFTHDNFLMHIKQKENKKYAAVCEVASECFIFYKHLYFKCRMRIFLREKSEASN